ncbi:hypothetical protein BP5796_11948 [Coleophoma crateriformis]|uniref:nitrilase n=1 Tax=Coleophoma crateriformis TaxID=565419 RepID=A0A3D8QC44_9HELO|nr:hypothetical protein BP5796_11948 [Coleophoma crateriformis]
MLHGGIRTALLSVLVAKVSAMVAVDSTKAVRVAVTQAEPEWLDLPATFKKTCRLIEEAAKNGAQLISFPECWISGYPSWIWARSVDVDMTAIYNKNSLKADSPEMQQICTAAKENSIAVCLGFAENYKQSLYIAQALIGADGTILMQRRKLKATHMERTIFGEASASSLQNVPLLKYHTYMQTEDVHIAAWPPVAPHTGGSDLWSMSGDGARNLSRTYAIESQSFVIHTTAVISQKSIDLMRTQTGVAMNTPGGGTSAVFGPDGRQLTADLPEDEEGIIYANLDMTSILHAKGFIDVCGHYSRHDLLWLGVDLRDKKPLRAEE